MEKQRRRTNIIDSLSPICLGNMKVDMPILLAPMSGISDRPFRSIVQKFGVGAVVSEMIASEAVLRKIKDSRKLADDFLTEENLIVQLAGTEPAIFSEAAKVCEDKGAKVIDINFGCPARKVVGKTSGSALMRDEELAVSILESVVQAVKIPVTVKMRLGWDDKSKNAPKLAAMAEDLGIQMICVHGRTRCQFFNGHANWLAVRETVNSVNIPVIVNGDIHDSDEAKLALRLSGAAGLMIGRAACGQPWLISQIATRLMGIPDRENDIFAVFKATVLEHYDAMIDHYGKNGVRLSRKHLKWYFEKNTYIPKRILVSLLSENSPAVLREKLVDILDQLDSSLSHAENNVADAVA